MASAYFAIKNCLPSWSAAIGIVRSAPSGYEHQGVDLGGGQLGLERADQPIVELQSGAQGTGGSFGARAAAGTAGLPA